VKVITLTTDFGVRDWFVCTMKGIILSLYPRAAIVDLTHEIPPGDIRAGAFASAAAFAYFPKRTVHVVVVDPGVGSSRAALAIETKNCFFVGPDNGVLSLALKNESIKSVRRLENQSCFLQPVSRTFHGRDVFAPVAARLCKGFPIHKLGPTQSEFVRLRWPEPSVGRNEVRGEILYIDRFGNLITNIGQNLLPAENLPRLGFKTRRATRTIALASHYQAVPPGKLVALIGSSGLLEISANGGSAAEELGLRVGDRFGLSWSRAEKPIIS
jgi:S-adenosyl-L-methionine hydrolase (adenosine-forming)